MPTTTEIASANGTLITVTEGGRLVRLGEILQSTKEALKSFPSLKDIPNIQSYCMSIWQKESGFNCFPSNGINSRHEKVVSGTGLPIPDSSQLWPHGRKFWRLYWNDTSVVNYRKDTLLGVQSDALLDGLYAHGISAAMGAYHIRGSAAFNSTFGSPEYESIAQANGLIVSLGTRVTSIYTEDEVGRKRSIVAGLIILDKHYHERLNRVIDTTTLRQLNSIGEGDAKLGDITTRQQAILLAAGDYLGFGEDVNGATGEQRAMYVRDNRSWTYNESSSSRTYSSSNSSSAKPLGCV